MLPLTTVGLVVLLTMSGVLGVPKSGRKTADLLVSNSTVNPTTTCHSSGLYSGSTITVRGNITDLPEGYRLALRLNVFRATCANLPVFDCSSLCRNYNLYTPFATDTQMWIKKFYFEGSRTQYHNDTINISHQMCEFPLFDLLEIAPSPTTTEGPSPTANATTSSRRKRSEQKNEPPSVQMNGESGVYVVQLVAVLKADALSESNNEINTVTVNVNVNFELKNPHGYLSAVDYPALVFYGIMTALYIIYAIAWLIMLGLNYTDLVRLQFWVLGVILLGFLEKALFVAEYDSVNQGNNMHWLIIVAVVVSAVKRSLSRMLLVIVSLGYGIVKPRLGDSLSKVIGAGVIYWMLATVYGVLRARNETANSNDTSAMISYALLLVMDFCIMAWVFTSIIGTRRTLRIRKNMVKLAIYNHFAYALIFSIIAAIGFVIWDLLAHLYPSEGCLKDWGEVWLHDCFWHVLFAIILGIIMIVWRPGANNKRFAYSLVDDEDNNEEIEQGTNKNFESVKMRQVGGSTSEPPPPSTQAEEDLRWVEENLPTSAIDKALPLIMDSDEELMTTKFESSKVN